jgi:hypothetical protein
MHLRYCLNIFFCPDVNLPFVFDLHKYYVLLFPAFQLSDFTRLYNVSNMTAVL